MNPHVTLDVDLPKGYRVRARKQRMDSGGYVGGVYFGHVPGTAIYDVATNEGQYTVRARTRGCAVSAVRRLEERAAARAMGGFVPRCAGCHSAWCLDPSCGAMADTGLSIMDLRG